MSKTTFTVSDDKKSLLMERTFSTSQHKLWQAYADPRMLEQWFAPKGWSTTVKKHAFVDGGEYVYIMKCEDKSQGDWYGKTSAGKMVFGAITPESSFEYRDYFTDDDGVVNESMPSSQTQVQLVDNGDGTTTLKVRTTYQTEEALRQVLEMGMQEGYDQTLDKLEGVLAD